MGYLVPPLAIVMGWLILGDVPPLLALAGGVLCLAGVAVTRGARSPTPRLGFAGEAFAPDRQSYVMYS